MKRQKAPISTEEIRPAATAPESLISLLSRGSQVRILSGAPQQKALQSQNSTKPRTAGCSISRVGTGVGTKIVVDRVERLGPTGSMHGRRQPLGRNDPRLATRPAREAVRPPPGRKVLGREFPQKAELRNRQRAYESAGGERHGGTVPRARTPRDPDAAASSPVHRCRPGAGLLTASANTAKKAAQDFARSCDEFFARVTAPSSLAGEARRSDETGGVGRRSGVHQPRSCRESTSGSVDRVMAVSKDKPNI
jgi:hypothetical protein